MMAVCGCSVSQVKADLLKFLNYENNILLLKVQITQM